MGGFVEKRHGFLVVDLLRMYLVVVVMNVMLMIKNGVLLIVLICLHSGKIPQIGNKKHSFAGNYQILLTCTVLYV